MYLSFVPALPCTDLPGVCLYLCIYHLFPLSPVQICLVGVVLVYLSFVPALPCTDLPGVCLYLCIYHLFPLSPVQICLVCVCTCVSIICSRSPLYRSAWCVFVLVYLSFVPALPCTDLPGGCCTCVSIICSRSPLYRSAWCVFVLVYLSFVPALPCTDLPGVCLYLCIYHLFPLSPVQICLVGVVLVYLSFVPALPCTDLSGGCSYLCIYHLFPLSPVQICLVGVCTRVSIICSRSPLYRSAWWVFVLVYLSFVLALLCTDLPGVCLYLCIYHLSPLPCTDLSGGCLYLCIYHLFPLSPVQICLVGVCTRVSIICSRSPLYRSVWCVFVLVYLSFVPALPCTDLSGGCLYLCIYHLFPLSPVQIYLVGVCTRVSIICSRSPLYRSAWWVFVLVYLSFFPAFCCTDLAGGCLILCWTDCRLHLYGVRVLFNNRSPVLCI